jgi:hypothetical protein
MPIEHKPHRASSSVLAHLDGLLDEALEQTFPASDAVAIDFERESHDREARVLDSRTPLADNRKLEDCTEHSCLVENHYIDFLAEECSRARLVLHAPSPPRVSGAAIVSRVAFRQPKTL